MFFSVYLIISVKSKKKITYVGYTNNLKKRFYDKRLAMSFEYKLKKDKKKRKYLLNIS